ncbi:MAG: HAD domain-containing protein [Alphaproteobacteria bacterium]
MKIIFVDFEGPLCHVGVRLERGNGSAFDKRFVTFLDYACKMAPAKIVCISDSVSSKSERDRRFVEGLFKEAGLQMHHLHKDWSAYGLSESNDKKDHINAWLHNHPRIKPGDCVTIDDNVTDVPNFVQISFHDGVLERDRQKIADLLQIDYTAMISKRMRNWAEQYNKNQWKNTFPSFD